jgi:hypothetical protein
MLSSHQIRAIYRAFLSGWRIAKDEFGIMDWWDPRYKTDWNMYPFEQLFFHKYKIGKPHDKA